MRDKSQPVLDCMCTMPFPTCDVPALQVAVLAYSDPGGGTSLTCRYCGQRHRHRGFGHRLAQCADPRGRGYVLVQAESATPSAVHRPPRASQAGEMRI